MKLGQILAVNYMRARLNLLAVLSKKRAAEKALYIFSTPFYRNNKQLPPVFDKAEKISLRIKGTTINGFRWNPGGSKRILVLHGFESSCRNFDAYIVGLAEKGYEVLAFDAPAHGVSGGKQITLPLYIEMITAIHFQVGILQGMMAHSFGGMALMHFIEKVPNANMRVALVAPLTETNTAINSFFRFLQLNEAVRAEFEKLIEAKSGVPPSYFSIPRALQNIKASILWVQDEDDEVTPLKDVKPVMDLNYPNITFMITRGLGHKRVYRDRRVVQAVVDFL